jgi:phage tail-like protein
MRALMPDQHSPQSVAAQLPGVYQGVFVVDGFCDALDDVLAPVLLTLDSMPAYLDPQTTPHDMLGWLAGWVGIALDPAPSADEQRTFVREAAQMLRWRGTARGLQEAIRLETGWAAEIEETGGTEWSSTPGAELPGEAGNRVIVRVTAAQPDLVDAGTVEEIVEHIVAASIPAHVGHRIEVVASTSRE